MTHVKYQYKMPDSDTAFRVEVHLWHTSEEWAKSYIHVGDYVKLRHDEELPLYNDEEEGIVMYHKGRICGKVDYGDLQYLNMFFRFEKIGKIGSIFGTTLKIKVYPYSNFENETDLGKSHYRPLSKAGLRRQEHNRSEEQHYIEACGPNNGKYKPTSYAVLTGCSFFIGNLTTFYNYIESHIGWLMVVKRKRVGERVIMGGYISGRLVGYIPERLAQKVGYLFAGKNQVVARINSVVNVDNWAMLFGGERCVQELAILLEISVFDNDEVKDLYYNPMPILDISIPATNNPNHPLFSAWHSVPKDINADKKVMSIKSENYHKLSHEYNDRLLTLLLSEGSSMKGYDEIKKAYYDEEDMYDNLLPTWEERVKSIGMYVPK